MLKPTAIKPTQKVIKPTNLFPSMLRDLVNIFNAAFDMRYEYLHTTYMQRYGDDVVSCSSVVGKVVESPTQRIPRTDRMPCHLKSMDQEPDALNKARLTILPACNTYQHKHKHEYQQ